MRYYDCTVCIRLGDGLQRLEVLRLIVEAPNRIDAITSAIHTYRLSVPEKIKALDLEIGEVIDVTQAIEELFL